MMFEVWRTAFALVFEIKRPAETGRFFIRFLTRFPDVTTFRLMQSDPFEDNIEIPFPTAPPPQPAPPTASFYGYSWDVYVRDLFAQSKREGDVYPGDEWGDKEHWEITYQQLFAASNVESWKKAVEIGPGSGKYTDLVLNRTDCSVLAADVSEEFLRILKDRFAESITANRLHPVMLQSKSADELYRAIAALGWVGELDALFSIDSMVHVDLQYLAAYFVTAAITLRVGGHLILTLADATTRRGRLKLLEDINLYYPMQGMPSLKFEWLSPDLISSLLPELGFAVTLLGWDRERPETARDLWVVARLVDPVRADQARKYIGL